MDGDILKRGRVGVQIRCPQEHRSSVLVKEFRCRVDVVVGACIRSANDHDSVALGSRGRGVIHTVVTDRRLQKVGVLFKPEIVSHALFSNFAGM